MDIDLFFACVEADISSTGVDGILSKYGCPSGYFDAIVAACPDRSRPLLMKQWLIDNRPEAEKRIAGMLGLLA